MKTRCPSLRGHIRSEQVKGVRHGVLMQGAELEAEQSSALQGAQTREQRMQHTHIPLLTSPAPTK